MSAIPTNGRLATEVSHPVLARLEDEGASWARRAALATGAGALALFLVLIWQEGIPRSIDPRQWEVLTQVAVLAFVAVGYLWAWKWELAGALAMLIGSVTLGVLASIAYAPRDALLGCLAFFIPGVLFLAHWQRSHSLKALVALAGGIVALLAFGGVASARVFDYYYGPSHPSSDTRLEEPSFVDWIWTGGVTTDGFVVKARLAGDAVEGVRLWVEPVDPAAGEGIEVPGTVSAGGEAVAFTVTGLEPDTEYRYVVRAGSRAENAREGRVRTFANGPQSFTVAIGACLRTGSNGQVFDRIRELDPALFLISGDFHYEDISSNEPARMRAAFDRNLEQDVQQALYLNVPIAYVWDDHDFGGNDSSAVSDARFASRAVYGDYVPHYPLDQTGPVAISQAFTAGRVRFIVLDTRSARTPDAMPEGPDKTMLGSVQKEWFKRELLAADGVYPLIVVVSSVPWIADVGTTRDDWGGFATERREIANFIAEHGIDGVAMVSGDAHMVAMDDGSNSDYSDASGAALPVLQAGALDRRGTTKGGPYSEGEYPGGGQFVLMTVEDHGGSSVTVRWDGINWKGETIASYTFESPVPQ